MNGKESDYMKALSKHSHLSQHRRKRFESFDDEDQSTAMQKFTSPDFDGNLSFYEYIWILLTVELKDYRYNYYEEVGKACVKFADNENLNIMEQILVYMSGQEDEINEKYPDMKKHQYYQHFWDTIDKWISLTDEY